MRILVGWDTPDEADLIAMYLGVEENEVTITGDVPELERQIAGSQRWDAILLSINLPDADGAFALFERLRQRDPGCPIVGACQQKEVYRVARFITHGMRSYVIRDPEGDWMFLLEACLESVVHAVRAERDQMVALKLREEIESVRRLQETIIPRQLDCPAGFQVTARYETSQLKVMGGRPISMAGGDYYDVFRIDDEHAVVLVGDASGHGMKACMSILTMHTLVRMIRNNRYDRTADFVAAINRHLCEQSVVNDEGGFITLLYGILSAARGEFQWSSAGHPLPLLQNLDDGTIEPIGSMDSGGLPLGIADEVDYETHIVRLPPRCRLLLYTDGLIEAFPGEEEGHAEFGIGGVTDSLRRSRERTLDQTLQTLFDDSLAFTAGSGRHDDTSIVLLERDGTI